ncbi:MAG: hypothetical protein AAF184_10825 [Pseudomonadota bacterium]
MSDDNDYFIGYAAETPARDRRFMLRLGLSLTLGCGALGAGLAAFQRQPGNGTWDVEDRQWQGVVHADPFPMLRTRDVDGTVRSLWLVCPFKCGVRTIVSAYDGQAVTLRGSLIARDGFYMLAAAEGSDWIAPASSTAEPALGLPAAESLERVTLVGEILDMKCFAGAMRPSTGKPHKACASLCIRGGVPPALFARDRRGAYRPLLLVDENGEAHSPEPLLPLVADPVRIEGQLLRRKDTLFLSSPIADIRRT